SLRTVFAEEAEGDLGPRQIVLPVERAEVPFAVVDVAEEEVGDRLAEASGHAFDLTAEIPIRVKLFRVSESEHVLLLLIHHIASDAWSRTPLARDLTGAYAARCAGDAPGWKPLPVQ
ncbi:condensation domain-containing protein, partial [Streptomyces sp. NRRL S-474]